MRKVRYKINALLAKNAFDIPYVWLSAAHRKSNFSIGLTLTQDNREISRGDFARALRAFADKLDSEK